MSRGAWAQVAVRLCLLAGPATWVSPSFAADPPQAAEAPAPAASAIPSPRAECLGVLDRLSAGIPRDETGPELQRKGLKIKSPVIVPDGVVTETDVASAVRVRVKIDAQGRVIPGSVTVQQAVGDPKLAMAMSDAVPQSLSFDVSGAFTVPKEFAFTTVYVNCARR